MANNNTIQKKLITILTKTHQDAQRAYKMAIDRAKDSTERATIGRIYEAITDRQI